MRKFFIPLLMVSAALPAAAMAQDRDWSNDRRAERTERQDSDRGQRRQSSASTQVQQSQPAPRERSFDNGSNRPRIERSAPSVSNDSAARREVFQRRFEERTANADAIRAERDARVERGVRVNRDRRPTLPPAGSTTTTTTSTTTTVPGTPTRTGRGFEALRDRILTDGHRVDTTHHRDWTRNWRDDHRYDWRHYRDRNRSVFRVGIYYDPYRYSYRRFNVGYNLWPSYYSYDYWLQDPWMYRLPPAYGPYRWVRYYDDALLVNIYTGTVVDVIYDFFW